MLLYEDILHQQPYLLLIPVHIYVRKISEVVATVCFEILSQNSRGKTE
jgi:hypothetical protein